MSNIDFLLVVILGGTLFMLTTFFWVGCFLHYMDKKRFDMKSVLNLKF